MTAGSGASTRTLRVRWLGRVAYQDAHALQHGLFAHSADDHLLLLEHPHVFTLGPRGSLDHLLVDAEAVGAQVVRTDRGGDITYHGPGQLVGYPVLTVPGKRGGGMADTVAYVRSVEQLLIDTLADLGLADVGRIDGLAGVWVAPDSDRPRKVAAIGVKLSRGRSMHGFALNVDTDLEWFDRIVPCGITDKGVTSLRAEGLDVDMATVVDALVARAVERWGQAGWDRADVRALPSEVPLRLGGMTISERKPEWLRAPVRLGEDYRALRKRMRRLDLVTVCEEAGCPNISECWADGTATFMLNGERCTRACGFCLVDTRKPDAPPELDEPRRVADAVAEMGLRFAVLTAVARDDLPDGGAGQFAATIEAIRRRSPGTEVEVLIPDCKGDPEALDLIFRARPDVLNHNLETVARLQRAVRPSAGYARSLAVLARAKAAGLTTKSGMILGLGETEDEVVEALADLAAVGTDIVTLGQYLRPTARHLPVERWWTPEEFERLAAAGEQLGIGHVEAGPLVRSSYHAREAAEATTNH
ncbi:MAG TPA: lipoyl synthase [Acidimicrobiales bacterium]|nr:lipoyl synthase [Acidimicrobiales bacterium]